MKNGWAMKSINLSVILFFLTSLLMGNILKSLSSNDPDVISKACIEISKDPRPQYINEIKSLLYHKNQLVRHSAAFAISVIGGVNAEKEFLKLLELNSVEHQRVGISGLSKIFPGKYIVDKFSSFLNSKSDVIKKATLIGMSHIADRDWLVKLEEMKIDESTLKWSDLIEDVIQKIKSTIRWFYNYTDALDYAKSSDKMMCLFFYLPNDKWSQLYQDNQWQNQDIVQLLNDWVCVKLNVIHLENKPWVDEFKVEGAPTIVLLRPNGNMDYRLIRGFISEESFQKELKDFKDPSVSLFDKEFDIAKSYLENNKLEQAIEKLNEIKKMSVDDISKNKILFALGFSYGKLAMYSKSNDVLNEINQNLLTSIEVEKMLYCKGLNYLAINDIFQAKKQFELILELNPNSRMKPTVHKILDKINMNNI